MTFEIPYPKKKTEWTKRYSLNKYYAGKHWAERSKDAEYWHYLTVNYAPKKMFTKPVIITFYFNDGLDISNHSAIAKMIEDGLKGIVIQDDNRKCVVGHEYYFHDRDTIRVKIREA